MCCCLTAGQSSCLLVPAGCGREKVSTAWCYLWYQAMAVPELSTNKSSRSYQHVQISRTRGE
jgi:hypothetical protein